MSMATRNTLLKINFVLVFILGFYSNAYSLSCKWIGDSKPMNWHEFNHPSLQKGSFEKVTQGEESLMVKLRGYIYYLHKNKITRYSCSPVLVVEPIFFNETYSYIILSNSDKEIQNKIRECLETPLSFGTPERNHTNYPLLKRNEFVSELVNEKVIRPHPEEIKTCEVVLEGRVIKEKLPYLDAWYIGDKSYDELTRPIFVTETVHSMKKVD